MSVSPNSMDYLKFFGLLRNPFPVAPDDVHFFVSRHIDQILTELVHGMSARKGFMLLVGEIGLGKTTISRRLIKLLEDSGMETSLVFHTSYQDVELLREINRDFGLKTDLPGFGDQMRLLNAFLIKACEQGKNCAIIIDDAQNLNPESLELVRMISNLEAGREKLVQILLVGQPELLAKLDSPNLRQLKSRIIIREQPRPLSLTGIEDYLAFKLNTAGNQGLTRITKSALRRIHRYTKGNFRQINILMDRCLMAAFLRNTTVIDHKTVKDAYKDLNPETPLISKRLIGFAAALLTVVFVAIGYWYLFPKSGPAAGSLGASPTPVQPLRGPDLAQATDRGSPEPVTHPIPSPPPTSEIRFQESIPEAVVDFARANQIEDFTQRLAEAVKTDQWNELAPLIYARTGRRILRFEHLSEKIRQRYGVLSFTSPETGTLVWLVCWRPPFTIDRFYYKYRGPEVLELQKHLTRLGLYQDKLDSIVGPNLMNAVIGFQRREHMEITGYPDPALIFLICHAQNASQEGIDYE